MARLLPFVPPVSSDTPGDRGEKQPTNTCTALASSLAGLSALPSWPWPMTQSAIRVPASQAPARNAHTHAQGPDASNSCVQRARSVQH